MQQLKTEINEPKLNAKILLTGNNRRALDRTRSRNHITMSPGMGVASDINIEADEQPVKETPTANAGRRRNRPANAPSAEELLNQLKNL